VLFDWLDSGELMPLAGRVADLVGVPVLLITGFIGIGAFLGTVAAWLRDVEPDWAGGAGRGGLAGGAVGILLTVVDYVIG
jgi:hypothetical protein